MPVAAGHSHWTLVLVGVEAAEPGAGACRRSSPRSTSPGCHRATTSTGPRWSAVQASQASQHRAVGRCAVQAVADDERDLATGQLGRRRRTRARARRRSTVSSDRCWAPRSCWVPGSTRAGPPAGPAAPARWWSWCAGSCSRPPAPPRQRGSSRAGCGRTRRRSSSPIDASFHSVAEPSKEPSMSSLPLGGSR